jgi:2-aminoadipate transaminase
MTIDDRSRRDRPGSRADLERYAGLFAARTRGMKSSAMRDLMAITERPEVISLAGGLPDTSTFPPESLAALLSHMAATDSAKALQYAPTDGIAAVRDCIETVMAAEGMDVDPQDVLVTTGGQQVIDLVCKTLVDPGDVVIAEAPTYPGAIPAFTAYQADVVQIAMDEDGMKVDELEATLDRLDAEGRTPKFVYTIPTFQNPGGVTMSLPRRKRLVEVANERRLLVLEDNPYGLLRYEGESLPTLHSLDAGQFVIYLGTFSKILSAGIRIGWAVAPAPVLEKMNMAKQGVDLCSSSLSQLFVTTYFAERRWEDYLEELRGIYKARRDVMLESLAEHFPPEATWTRPQGGLFVWVTLPDYIDTTDLLARALEERNVAFVPGRGAYMDGRGGSSMRLNFSGVGEDEIREGVRRIGEVIREQVALYGTLTGQVPAPAAEPAPRPADAELADVLELPRRERSRREAQ